MLGGLCGVVTYIDVEIEMKTSSNRNIEHGSGQGDGFSIMTVLATHIQELAIVVELWMIVCPLLREVAHCGDHPLHVGELLLLPAAGGSLKLTVRELVSSRRGGG